MANYPTMGSARQFDEAMDDEHDDKDDTKRKSRNLSEKKRRDQFNMLVNELGSMITTNSRKMDKSTVLRSTILFLKNHDEVAVRSRVHEIQEDWKPSFLSNDEFTHLILEALDGFIMVFSSSGRIYYASESVTSLLGYLPSELTNATIYEITYQDDQSHLYNVLLNPGTDQDQSGVNEDNQVSFTCHIRRGGLDLRDETTYELVHFVGYFRTETDIETLIPNNRFGNNVVNDTKCIFVGTGRLQTPQLIRDMSFIDSSKSEFTSRHSLEWKFLFLDHRAPPIIGYLPFEVLGTSGYDYYHVDDLDKVVKCHESLMQKGEGTSCHYRFLTKGQQWIWLKTRFYLDYNQWNSKPEFIVCTHNVVSYTDVIKQFKTRNNEDAGKNKIEDVNQTRTILPQMVPCEVRSSPWSPKSSKPIKSAVGTVRIHYQGGGSDTTSISAGSQSSRQSVPLTQNSRPRATPAITMKTKTLPEPPLKHRKQTDIVQPSPSYIELKRFTTAPVLPVVPANYVTPAISTTSIALPTTALMNQHNIAMTTAQNHIQGELQRKHEELQQLIVHQQEELRRVSEQLLVARYGILSPLVNSGLPYNASPGQLAAPRSNSPSGREIANSPSEQSIQGLNVIPVPGQLSVPVIPLEPFSHSTVALSVHDIMMPRQQPQQQPRQQERAQLHQEIQGNEQQHQSQPQQLPHQDDHMSPMMQFQMCSSIEIPYANVELAARTQQGLNH